VALVVDAGQGFSKQELHGTTEVERIAFRCVELIGILGAAWNNLDDSNARIESTYF